MLKPMDTHHVPNRHKLPSLTGEAVNSDHEFPTAVTVKRTNTSSGTRVSTLIKQEFLEDWDEVAEKCQRTLIEQVVCNTNQSSVGSDEAAAKPKITVKKEFDDVQDNVEKIRSILGFEVPESDIRQALLQCGDNADRAIELMLQNRAVKGRCAKGEVGEVKEEVADCEVVSVKRVKPLNLEDGEFDIEAIWLNVGSTFVTAVSTSKGMKLLDHEVVHISFPKSSSSYKTQWIVRFSTKRSGEIGRFPMEWAKCVVPLVDSGKVKVLGRFLGAPKFLSMMQDIVLSVSFYVHPSIFNAVDMSSWKQEDCNPILTLFKLLKLQPYQKVLLMCLRTEVGYDLSAASNIFLMDPWWNPAEEEKILVRIIHSRKHPTVVRRFIVKDTVEERMQQLQSRQQQMSVEVVPDEKDLSA